ncbi:MAG: hypothetical protein HY907_21510 [Deltaproteobacteria bacterium]|nr:hypothetical protein [Deltaproteobacteria bacterium]
MAQQQEPVRTSRDDGRGSRAGAVGGYFLWLLVSLALIVGPFVLPVFSAVNMSSLAQLICLSVGIFSLILMSVIVVITKLYQKASANRSLVRTGMGGIKVILDGGVFNIPVLHKLLSINLETMRLDVERKGKDALITADFLRSDLSAQFYLKVQPTTEDITNAARSLGERSVDDVGVKELVFDKLVSALRTVAAKSTLFDLNSERERFARDVKAAVEADLKHNGLTLESVTISSLDQTDVTQLNERNVFDAQGRKRIAEVTQAANVERNRLEREAEQQIATKDVSTRKSILTLDLEKQKAEAEQARDVANSKAEAGRRAAEFKIEQEQAVAQREVEKLRAVEAAKIDAQKKLVITNQERELAEVQKQQAVETANVSRNKVVEVAMRDQQIAVAAKEQERAKAEAARLAAEAEREGQAQAVKTVEAVRSAERSKDQGVIAAQADAEKRFVQQQREADAEAYRLKALADGKKAAAEAEAYAKIRAAEAEKESAEKRALGDLAVQSVPVNVAAKQVDVDKARQLIGVQVAEKQVEVDRKSVEVTQARVNVERQELEQRQQFSRAALEFELGKLRITKAAEVQVESAKAIGSFMAKGQMTIFGDPSTMAMMTERFMSSMAVGRQFDGFFNGLGDGPAREAVGDVLGAVTGLAQGAAALMKGKAEGARAEGEARIAEAEAKVIEAKSPPSQPVARPVPAPAAAPPAPGRPPGTPDKPRGT